MHLPYILLAAIFLAVANAAAIIPAAEVADDSNQHQQQQLQVTEESGEGLARPKRGLLLAKAAVIGGGLLGAKLIAAKSHGGWGGYGGYGGYGGGWGGYGRGYGGYGHGYGGGVTYHHYVQPTYYSSGWYSGPSYYSSW